MMRISCFWQRLMDQIQYDDQNVDGVDQVHQHQQNLDSPIHCPGSTFHLVTLGSFDLYTV